MSRATPPAQALSGQDRRALLAELLRKKARAPKSYPLSFSQQRLWFIDQLDGGNPAYNMGSAIRLAGALDRTALARSLSEIVRRHAAIRTTFTVVDDSPRQIVVPIDHPLARAAAQLPLIDLRALAPAEQATIMRRLTNQQTWQPFDLVRGPLLRCALIALDDATHVLLIGIYHIIADGWAMGVLIRELVTLYAAFAAGRPSPLPELPIQYADYAVWQRESLQGELVERQLGYWRTQLAELPALDLPTDRPRPLVQDFHGRQQRFGCSVPLTAALNQLGQQEGATLFMVLLAAYQALLARYSGQDDIVVGSPIANRTRVELESLIGVFVNMLALRADLSGDPSFRTLLGRVRELTFAAYAHQDLPFEQIVEALQPQRDLSRTPLFQVIFVLQNSPMPAAELHGMVITPAEIDIQTSRFDLGLSVWEIAQGLEGGLEYSTALFDATTITRMLHHFDTLLAAIVAQPDRRLADLPLLNDAERQQLLVEWNATNTTEPAQAFFHQLFVAQAVRTPDMIAAVFEDTHLTYAELNALANRLAHELRTLGVGPDVLVGLCVERSLALVIGLLGIFKAGGAYVPLDPAYPPERLAFMLADANVALLLTQSSNGESGKGTIYRALTHATETCDLPVSVSPELCIAPALLDLRAGWPRIAQRSAANPTDRLSPDNLAYMIYTSGSTGQPKGVLVPHRGLGNLARVKQRICAVAPGDRQLQFASISFDAVISEIVTALPWGATLCLARRESLLPGPGLTELLRDYAITTVALPPSALMILAPEELPALRTITVAGEASSADLIARWARGRRIINGYGPTEGTVGAAMNSCLDNGQPPPIGRPIANTQLYLLDRHMRPVAIGVPGELYIQGIGLARGYHNRPDLTAERFVPNPFGDCRLQSAACRLDQSTRDYRLAAIGYRLYKTGDLARYRPDGSIAFLGRIDDQVKLRGFRIELREIEAALRQHGSVREALVLVREDVVGDQRLVAYVVTATDAGRRTNDERADSSCVSELRAFLAARLPDYMLPSAFVLLDALPRTPNGKLDRRALPAPAQTRDERDSFVAPRTPVEEVLARIWEQILGVAPVGSADNFFALGGHSLLATQVIARVRQMLHVALPVRALFETPTLGGLAEQIERERRSALGLDMLPLQPIPHAGPVPLSFAQQRLWFLDQLVPNSPFYNVPTAVRLDGALDLPALAHSLNGVVRRHEALRTTFAIVDGQPAQLIAAALHLPLPLIDLHAIRAEQRQSLALRLVVAEARRPFDLVRGPLVRALLLRLAADEHLLFLAMHHIISDGWSMGVLIGEVAALYAARVLRQPATLPTLPIQYPDFTYWQREWLQGAVLATQMAYWKRQLGAQPPVLALPTDRPRPAFQTFRGARQRVRVPAALTEALLALSRANGTTLFMTLLATFQTLLARYSGQRDIVVGAPIANRTRAELEPLIGFFVNTLVLRGDLSGDPSFRALLARVRETTLDAHAHQDLPFEKLVEELQPNRDPSRNPLFQVMFVLQNAPMPALSLPNLTLQPIETYNGTAKFDLWLGLGAGPDGLFGALEYNVDLFDDTTILRLRAHLLTLLASVTTDPQHRLADLPLLTAPEQQQVIAEWNDTRTDYAELCVHRLCEMQVERTPDAIAVAFGDAQLSYAELDQRANQLAQHLRCLGATVGTLIAICMDRSLELIVGLLGILKAGAAYVPLDPASPPDRLAFMLADSQAPLLLTDALYGVRLTIDDLAESRTAIVNLASDWPMIARQPASSPASGVTAGHLGYVIYTSGSTGKPKGVAMPHRALVNLLIWQLPYLHHRVGTRFLQFASLSFDVSYQEIFPTLASGGTIVLISEELRRDAPALWRLLAAQHAERIYLPYVGLQQLAEAAEQPGPQPRRLREITVSGEQLQITRAITRMFQILAGATLHNFYGPSESHAVTAQTLTGAPEQWPTLVPIGRPIANSQMYLLDRQLRPVAAGLPGELYIGGECLADGYLHRPDLTAERFVPNPFVDERRMTNDEGPDSSLVLGPSSCVRLYKTGDLARYRPDGSIEFLGRIDDQIKIRGFRVELEEIAAVLRAHAAVQKCAVIVREDIPGDKRLVAYVVPTEDERRTADDEGADPSIVQRRSSFVQELRAFLKPQLPDYMLPAAFVLLDTLPLTLNGKVNHTALPIPDQTRSDLAGAYVAPRTPIEEVLVGIWADVLRLRQIGVEDNFFGLGGHSLLATQVIARLREAFQVELPVRALFEAPTPAGLAERIATARRDATDQPVPAIQRHARSGALPLSFAQQRLWFLDQLQSGLSGYSIPAAVQLTGPLDVAALRASFDRVVARHEALRTTFTARDGQPAQLIAAVGARHTRPALPLLDLRTLPATACAATTVALATAEARRPFDLARGPLLRTCLLRRADDDHVLLLTLHHIVADGWSMGLLIQEVAACYGAHVTGQPAALPALPIQYADYTIWQREWLQGDVLDAQLGYWRSQLAGLPALELPTDFARPPVQTFRGAHQRFALSAELSAELLALSRRAGVTLFMLLLTAFQAVLARYSGQDDIVVGSPIAGRTQRATESLIGVFINTLVLRADLRGNPTFLALLGRARELTLAAYAHQDLPFERLVEELQPNRDLSRHPLFQVLFVLQNTPLPELAVADLTLRPLVIESGSAKFDLALSMSETALELAGGWEYSTELFEATTIRRLTGHFQTLLAGIAARPEQRLAELPLLTPAEMRQLLDAGNAAPTHQRADVCLHDLFAAQAQRTPDATALVSGAQHLSYAELNARANQLAHYLRECGVGMGVPVGLCLERSLDLVVALLGVLKAGAAYVPLDPTYPHERLAFMLADAGVTVLLTQTSIDEGGTGTIDRARTTDDEDERGINLGVSLRVSRSSCLKSVVKLDADWPLIAQRPTTNPRCAVSREQLAYVIYTSGTTGTPKGVMVEQRQLTDILLTLQTTLDLRAADVLPCSASCAFDIFLFQLWAVLLVGGRTILLAPSQVLDLAQFSHILQHVTILEAVPSLLRQLVAHLQSCPATRAYRGLRLVMPGGDLIPPELLRDLAQVFPQATLYPTYGPTESTIMATGYRLPPGAWGARTRLGRPLINRTIQVLDPQQKPVPLGVPGELYLGGNGVSRGYLNRPDLTAERFVPNPFADCRLDDPTIGSRLSALGSRLYRTGDRVRYRPDGMLEFLGRIDEQVKIRGFRIELGEIEAVLGAHPAVRQTVVLAREDTAGDKRLVAYVVPAIGDRGGPIDRAPTTDDQTASSFVQELRAFLSEKLPDYMIPAAFVRLDALPLNVNGKLDRRALPAPDQSRPSSAEGYVAPRTPTEEVIAGIWAEILGLAQIGADDHFFSAGGHSLLATQVIVRVRDVFQVKLALRTLFESPTLAAFAARVDAQRQTTAQPMPPIQPIMRGAPLPLSFAQQRLWFLDRLTPGTATYNIPTPVRLSGRLDLAALTQSLRTIRARQEVLRTTIALIDGQAMQIIAPATTAWALPMLDLQALPAPQRAAAARCLATAEAGLPFDLTRGPLWRATMLRLADDDHLVLLTMHHIAADGWSVGLLTQELAALYAAYTTGRPATLPDLPIQYADYAAWQQRWLRDAGDADQPSPLQTQLAYWRTQLASLPEINLPTDHPRPALQTFRGARRVQMLPETLHTALKQLSRQAEATPFMTLLAAFQALLMRYTGQTDLTVGTPIAGRTQRATERLIGFFVNTLVLRTDLGGNPSFRTLLGRVRHMALDAYAHQDLPFERLVEDLQPERDLSRSPLFQTMFALQNAPLPALKLAGLTLRPVTVASGTAKFDLTLSLSETPQGIIGTWEYATDLFEDTTIARMLGHFQVLLQGIVADPDRRLTSLPLLNAAERQQLLIEWNAATGAYSGDQSAPALFEAQVARTPDAIAATFDEQLGNGPRQISYRELNRRANELAHWLRRQGLGRADRVGVLGERGIELLTTLLATLKAGCVYVPLDPAHPDARLSTILADSGLRMIVAASHMRERALALAQTCAAPPQLCCWGAPDADSRAYATAPTDDRACQPEAHDLAYIFYTSGSTGLPKGAMIDHAGLRNHLCAKIAFLELTAGSIVAQTASHTFDISIWQFLAPLLAGAQVIIYTNEVVLDPARFLHALQRDHVNIVETVPTLLAAWLADAAAPAEQAAPIRLPALTHMISNAETLPVPLCHAWSARFPHAPLINTYGATETADDNTHHLMRTPPPIATQRVPVGRPIAGLQLYLLDAQLQPVPLGCFGQIAIAGIGVGQGYAGDARKTARAFVPNPFATPEDERRTTNGERDARSSVLRPPPFVRLYLTGDLGRWTAAGLLEFVGRIDRQVKLRGVRIELGEIEAALAQHDAVRECVVLLREDEPGDARLVAYVVPTAAEGRTAQDESAPASFVAALREFLTTRLPTALIPASVVLLNAMPLTPNGKVDRRALPLPALDGAARRDGQIGPRTYLEAQLTQIWEELLGQRPISVVDNFFALGGHSLLALRLMARIQKQFGRDLPLSMLFQGATIEQLAALLNRQTVVAPPSALVGIQTSGAKRPFFCVHPIGGNVLCYYALSQALGPDQPFYGVQSISTAADIAPPSDFRVMAANYVAALRQVQPHGPYLLGGWSLGGVVALEMARHLRAQGEPVGLLAVIDAQLPQAAAPSPFDNQLHLLQRFAQNIGLDVERFGPMAEHIQQLTPEAQLNALLEQAKQERLIPADIEPAQLRWRFRVFEANNRALYTYKPEVYPGRITFLQAREPLPGAQLPSLDGWRALAGGGFEQHAIPGDHLSIVRQPHVQALAEQLASCIAGCEKSDLW
jgi:amino acid adenylation domain-containing protein